MDRTIIKEQLNLIFRKVFSNNALTLTEELTANDVDQWDSLTHMRLITEIEQSFMIKFKLKELNKMRNVGDMIDLIQSKLLS